MNEWKCFWKGNFLEKLVSILWMSTRGDKLVKRSFLANRKKLCDNTKKGKKFFSEIRNFFVGKRNKGCFTPASSAECIVRKSLKSAMWYQKDEGLKNCVGVDIVYVCVQENWCWQPRIYRFFSILSLDLRFASKNFLFFSPIYQNKPSTGMKLYKHFL